jgi:hypothetical protein
MRTLLSLAVLAASLCMLGTSACNSGCDDGDGCGAPPPEDAGIVEAGRDATASVD